MNAIYCNLLKLKPIRLISSAQQTDCVILFTTEIHS